MTISFENEHPYNGIKVIEFGEKDFIGFIRQGVSTSFFPCRQQTETLRELGKAENELSNTRRKTQNVVHMLYRNKKGSYNNL